MYNNSDYYCWLLDKIGVLNGEYQDYLLLTQHLFSINYIWAFELDDNRAAGGIGLRREFAEEFGVYEDDVMPIGAPCTVLEMLIALARNITDMYEETEVKWFWEMMHNLGLTRCDDAHYDDKYVDQIINKWLNHAYDRNGKGSIFPMKSSKRDCRNLIVWDQMLNYMHENYPI